MQLKCPNHFRPGLFSCLFFVFVCLFVCFVLFCFDDFVCTRRARLFSFQVCGFLVRVLSPIERVQNKSFVLISTGMRFL